MGLEQRINYQLNKFPFIKKGVKRAYQRLNCLLAKPEPSEGDIDCVSPRDPQYEYFFGYYDKSPEDASGRYVLCLRAKNTRASVAPADPADILLIDTQKPQDDPGRVRVLATTHSWNVQQGCMLQWLGPDYSTRVIYNDFRDGQYRSVILDVTSGAERVLDMPVYTVSEDGTFALTLDFSRLHRLRPGYGYSNLPEATRDQKLPDATAIWRLDLQSGAIRPLLSYAAFADFEPRPEMKNAEHKVNHLMLSPGGRRFMVMHRWFDGGRKYTRLLTVNTDGTDMYNLSDDDFVSHCFWRDDETIIAFENKKREGLGYFLMTDRTQEYAHLWPQLNADGHPSYSPDRSLVVTDTYPGRTRVAVLRAMKGDRVEVLAKVYAPFAYDNDTRCDLHPRWSRDGRRIYFDSVFEGRRRLYTVAIPASLTGEAPPPLPREELVSCVIPSYKRCDTVTRAIDSVLAQSYGRVEVCVVDDNIPGDEYSQRLIEALKKYEGDPRVRYIAQERHINGAAARNAGIRAARGEYVGFLDDDDEWLPDKLRTQMACLLAHPELGGVTCLYNCVKDGKFLRRCAPYTGEDLQLKVLMRQVSIFTSTFLAKKSVLEAFGGFDEKLTRHQDLQLFVDFLNHGDIYPVGEYLVDLHVDSQENKPNAARMIQVKKAFFESVGPTLAKYDARTQRRIRAAHNFEVVFMAIKEKKYGIAAKYALRNGLSVQAYRDVLQRYKSRKYV